MPDKPFVINDRRKFTAEGEPRPDIAHDEPRKESPAGPAETEARGPQLVSAEGSAQVEANSAAAPLSFPGGEPAQTQGAPGADQTPPPPTPEQSEQAQRAYTATVDRLETAMRAMDPGADRAPAMNFERLIQSLYMQTLIQLGGAPEPGQPLRVDLIGARSTIDMLALIEEKTRGNLSEEESNLVQSALFEVRLGFLDVTQALAQQAAQRQPGGPQMPPPPGGPSLIR